MIKLVNVLSKDIVDSRGHMLCIMVSCENIDGRMAAGTVWLSRNTYEDSALDIDNILVERLENGLVFSARKKDDSSS